MDITQRGVGYGQQRYGTYDLSRDRRDRCFEDRVRSGDDMRRASLLIRTMSCRRTARGAGSAAMPTSFAGSWLTACDVGQVLLLRLEGQGRQ